MELVKGEDRTRTVRKAKRKSEEQNEKKVTTW